VNTSTSVSEVLRAFHYGLYVIGSRKDDLVSTIVANWVTQVSFTPPLISIAIETNSRIEEYIKASNVFSVNLLPGGAKDIAKAFIKPGIPRGRNINGREYVPAENGSPFLMDALACLSCNVVGTHGAGDHTLFIGEAVESVLHGPGDALTLKETGWQYRR